MFIGNLSRDLLLAARGFRRSPTLVTCALLSLGLGVNISIFSLALAFFFSQPSARDTKSLVLVHPAEGRVPETWIDSLRATGIFAEVAGENADTLANFNDATATSQIASSDTTKNYFNMLGAPILLGRGFTPEDHNEVVVLSYHFWQKYFQGDPAVVGRAINLDGRACTVVGILPKDHRTLTGFGFSPDLYQPRRPETARLAVYARLKPDMSLQQARAGLRVAVRRMNTASPAHRFTYANISLSPLTGYESLAGDEDLLTLEIFFGLLLTGTGLVLLIACANVAILLLARGSARRAEIAVRLALGASRPRLLQQFLAESLLLAALGTVLGLMLSRLTDTLIAAIETSLPGTPIYLHLTPDWRLLLYSVLLTAIATIVCGLFPAWQSWKVSIAPNLAHQRKSRLQGALVVAQIATSVVLLATAFLFLHNLLRANSTSPGFDLRHTLHAEINLPTRYRDRQRRAAYVHQVLHEVEALPGMECAAAATSTPFNFSEGYGLTITFPDNGQQRDVAFGWNAVTPAYFRTMAIPIYSGRTFSQSEPGVTQVIVNQPFVDRYLSGRAPLGTLFRGWPAATATSRIVAVVGNTKTRTLGEEEQPQLYGPLEESKGDERTVQLELRSAIAPAMQIEPVRRVLHRIEPLAAAQVQTMHAAIRLAFLPSQFGAGALGSLGALGLLLAAVGIYAVVTYSVVSRTREIGIRMAVGATNGNISRMVQRDAGRLSLIGSCIGLFAAIFITRPLAIFLVPGLKPSDPVTFVAVGVVMIVTAAVAASGPARRASRVDPGKAMRHE